MPRKNPFANIEALRLRNKALLDPDSNVVELTKKKEALSRKPGQAWGAVYFDEAILFQVPPALRLLIVLRYRSFRGRKSLVLDAGIAREAGIKPRIRARYARVLERSGLLRVEKEGQQILVVRVLRRS